MLTEDDGDEEDASGGLAKNCSTIRAVLALRNVIYSSQTSRRDFERHFPADLRVVVQITR